MEDLRALSDDALLDGIDALLGSQRQLLARLLGYLSEVESRELHLQRAYPSLYAFCLGRLGLSEDEACRRIEAARLARRFPVVLDSIETGALHLSGLLTLGGYLNEENHAELLHAASGKTKRQVQALLAERFPKPDVASSIRKQAVQAPLPAAPSGWDASSPSLPAPARVTSRLEPLSAARYKVEFTAGEALKDKLERALDLSAHSNPSRDLAHVIERGVDLMLDDLEKSRLGKTDRPRRARPRADPANVTRAARRAVFERDGERCAYVDEKTGKRCEARSLLQVDHVEPRALGGSGESDNLRPLCGQHNRFVARQKLGHERVERAIAARQRETAERKASVVPNDELQTVAARAELHEKLLRGLTLLGFKPKVANNVLEELLARRSALGPLPPIEGLMREALWTLTPA